MSVSKNQSIGLILAGGKGSRMGFKDKPFLRIGGRTIAQWILSQSEIYIDEFLFSLKQNHIKYHQFGHKIVCDISDLATTTSSGLFSNRCINVGISVSGKKGTSPGKVRI